MNEIFQLHLGENQFYPYKLVKSARAKYIRIKVSKSGDLSVVLPQGIHEKHAHGFLQKKLPWVSSTIKNMVVVEADCFPQYLDLKLLGETWEVVYQKSDINKNYKIRALAEYKLEISGNTDNWEATKKKLNQWCQSKAKPIFNNMAESLAEEHGFHFNKLTIRSQKTRWGSCSARKNISLNSKLLFMPLNVVRYVIIHELCHTVEMNHSSKFWALVQDCDVFYKNNRTELRRLGKEVIL